MMSNKGNAEEKLICPYDKSHHIYKHRMQGHLVKCQRNFPNIRIAVCAYNATHRVQEPELKYHLTTCPDRLLLDKFIYKPDNAEGADVKFPIPKLDLQPTEFWDDQEEVPTYNPEEHCKNNPILRNNIHTKSAAVRRGFRNEERARMQQFDDDRKNAYPIQPLGGDANQKQRRPTGTSAAIQNDGSHTDLCDIMQQLENNSNTLTTPKVPATPQNPMSVAASPAEDLEDSYLEQDRRLLRNHNSQEPRAGPWSAASLAMSGIASSQSVASRGRGSFLAKKK